MVLGLLGVVVGCTSKAFTSDDEMNGIRIGSFFMFFFAALSWGVAAGMNSDIVGRHPLMFCSFLAPLWPRHSFSAWSMGPECVRHDSGVDICADH